MECLKPFAAAVVSELEEVWLRAPTAGDFQRIESQYRKLGFPACIVCVECASWEWVNCPVAFHGQYEGKDKRPVCKMEVFCDEFLRIWPINFDTPGAFNEKTICDHSPPFNRVGDVRWPPVGL